MLPLSAEELLEHLGKVRRLGVRGGAVYDYMHLCAARKAGAVRIFTLNKRHFTAIAPRSGLPNLSSGRSFRKGSFGVLTGSILQFDRMAGTSTIRAAPKTGQLSARNAPRISQGPRNHKAGKHEKRRRPMVSSRRDVGEHSISQQLASKTQTKRTGPQRRDSP